MSVPVSWTNFGPEDPFIKISDGRSLFRGEDLLALHTAIEAVKERKNGND